MTNHVMTNFISCNYGDRFLMLITHLVVSFTFEVRFSWYTVDFEVVNNADYKLV